MTEENSGSAWEPEPQRGPEPTEPTPEPQSSELADSAVTDPAEAAGLLSEMRSLRRSARSARHAYWFPLVLFGVLTCVAVPFYIRPRGLGGLGTYVQLGPYTPLLNGLPGQTQAYLGYYWLVALLGGLALTLWWYRRHARRIGLRTPSRGYLVTVTVLTGLAIALPILSQIPGLRFLRVLWPGDLTIRGTFPFLIIAAGLCVLAWAERSRALAVIAAIYTGTALLASLYDIENILFRLGWNPSPNQWQLTSLPNVLLPAIVLLVGGLGAYLMQRRQRRAI
jgi:hypothetical protein